MKVKFVFIREDTSVEFVENPESVDLKMAALREKYNITATVEYSEDGLTKTLIQEANDMDSYVNFYNEATPLWEKTKHIDSCSKRNISVSMDVIEN